MKNFKFQINTNNGVFVMAVQAITADDALEKIATFMSGNFFVEELVPVV